MFSSSTLTRLLIVYITMAFVPLRYSISDARYGLIGDSQTLSVGEAITCSTNAEDYPIVITAGGTTGPVLGVVMGIAGKDGQVLEVNTHAAAATNDTVERVRVSYLDSWLPTTWLSDLDADAETTDNSRSFGNFAVDSTGLLVDESTVAAITTAEDKQLFSYGLTGVNTTQVEVRWISTMLGYNIA